MANQSPEQEPDMFPHIEPIWTVVGEEHRLAGTRLKVWQLVQTYRALGSDVGSTAHYFEIAASLVEEAVAYAQAHSEEIESAIRENDEMQEKARLGQLPGVEILEVPIANE